MARRTDGLTDPDLVPDLPSHPVTRPGDLWILGTHRLVCGDSTSPEDAAPLLAGVRPHLMVTDPPYGVNRDTDALTLASICNGAKPARHQICRGGKWHRSSGAHQSTSVKPFYKRECAWVTRCGPRNRAPKGQALHNGRPL